MKRLGAKIPECIVTSIGSDLRSYHGVRKEVLLISGSRCIKLEGRIVRTRCRDGLKRKEYLPVECVPTVHESRAPCDRLIRRYCWLRSECLRAGT